MNFKRLLLIIFSLIVVSCGNGSSSDLGPSDIQIELPQNYPTHPFVWDVVTPESVGMNSEYLDSALDYAFEI